MSVAAEAQAFMKQYQLKSVATRYYPEELVDFDRARTYRRDAKGYHLCEATVACPNLAIDYCGYCAEHKDGRGAQAISRFDAFRMGALPVEQLEDWELVRGVARQPKGLRANRHLREVSNANMVPLDQYRAMVAELFKRHDEKLRGMADSAIETLYEIMVNDANEPADRIKAATWIYERVRGKQAETLKLQVDTAEPWQQVIEGIARVTRDEAYATANDVVQAQLTQAQEPLEAEIIADPVPDVPEPENEPQSATQAQERADRIAAAKERRTKARNRRYAARAQGWDKAEDAQPIVKGNKVIDPEDIKSPEPKRDYRD